MAAGPAGRAAHGALAGGRGRHGRSERFSALADQAVVDVRKVLTSWRGRLVVEVPDDEEELGRVLGSEPGAYGGIAAVTTTADGSLTPDAPVHIFVNPRSSTRSVRVGRRS